MKTQTNMLHIDQNQIFFPLKDEITLKKNSSKILYSKIYCSIRRCFILIKLSDWPLAS